MEGWLATALGAGSGALLLALFARMELRALAMQGFMIFAVMLWIYVGSRLATGTLAEIAAEAAFALVAAGMAQWATLKWPPAIGIAILMHGAYDAFLGPHTGVAAWYPPLCAGFDVVVGAGLFLLFSRKLKQAPQT